MKKSIVKRIAVLAAIGVMTMTGASAAFAQDNSSVTTDMKCPVIEDQYAEAYMVDNCHGYIIINDTSIWDNGNAMTEICGIPLSVITDTPGDGYVTSISVVNHTVNLNAKAGLKLPSFIPDVRYTFTDETGKTSTLDIMSTSMSNHTTTIDGSKIVRISWQKLG